MCGWRGGGSETTQEFPTGKSRKEKGEAVNDNGNKKQRSRGLGGGGRWWWGGGGERGGLFVMQRCGVGATGKYPGDVLNAHLSRLVKAQLNI